MKTIVGDLLELADDGQFDIIVHGCNCQHIMGGGIAKFIRQRWPGVYEVDCQTIKGDATKLGTFSVALLIPKNKEWTPFFRVLNAYTQFNPGDDEDGNPPIDYEAVRKAFRQVKLQYGGQGHTFGIPKIGAGLAGGDWEILAAIIEDEMAGEDLTLVVLE